MSLRLRNNTSLGSFFASLTDMKRIETVCTKFQVRPICISYALLQLTGQGLPKKCQKYFGQYFQESTGSPKCPAIQLHRASEMALLSCISFLAPYTTWQHCLKLPRRTLLIQLPSSPSTAPTLSIASRGSNSLQCY